MTDGTGRENSNQQDEGEAFVRPDSVVQVEPKRGRRKRRRFIKAIAALLAAFVIIVITAPWVISWPPVSNYAVSIANSTLRGQIHLDKLSLSWFGPTVLEGLEIRDPASRPVVQVGRVELASGVLSLPSLRDSFGELVIHKPRIVLHLDDDNHASLMDAFATADAGETAATVAPKSPSSDESLTVPQGVIRINNGTIEVSRGDRGPTESFDLSGKFNIRSLNDIEGLLAITLSGGSRMTGELSVKGLAPNGRIDVQKASGTVKLAMDRPAHIGSIVEVLLQQTDLVGEAMITLDAQIAPNDLVAEIDAQIAGFQSKGRAARQAAPLDAAVRGTLSMKDNSILGRLNLSGTPGTAQTDFSYQIAESLPVISGDEILAAVLGGESLSLPDFSLSVDGDLDLAAFDRAVPGLIPLQNGQSLAGGNLKVTELRASGGAAPVISGSLHLTDLAAKDAKGTTRLSPLSLDISAELRPGTGLVIDRADLTSAPATVKAAGSINDMRAQFQCDLSKFQEELGRIVNLGQMSLTGQLDGSVKLTRANNERFDAIVARLNLSGTPGTAQTDFSYQIAESLPVISGDEILAAVLGGESLSLPDFSLSVDGDLDLAAFDRAVPGLIPLQSGQSLVGGNLKVTDFRASGGSAPAVSGSLQLTNLAAKHAHGTTTLSPVSLDLSARLEPGTGMVLDHADLSWAPATVKAAGSINELRAQFQSDLSALQEELGQIVELSHMQMAGRIDGSLALSRPTDERIDTNLQVNAQHVRYAVGDRVVELPRASISESGHVQLVDQKLTRIVADDLRADVNGEVITTATGWFDPTTQDFESSVNIRQLDLAAAVRRGASFGLDALAGYGGQISGELTAKREGSAAPVVSFGNLIARQISANGRRLLIQDASFNWSDLRIERSGTLAMASARIASDVANVDASALSLDSSTGGFPVGKINGSADLARVLGIIAAIAGEPQATDLRGRFVFAADVAPYQNGMRVVGNGAVAPLEFRSGDALVRERVEFVYDASVDLKNHRIVLDSTRVTSKPATFDLKGSIENYDSDLVASIQGNYDLSWKELTAVIHSFAPSTKDLILVEGKTTSDFSLKGPLNKPGARPAFHDLDAEAFVEWRTAKLAGVEVGRVKLAPSLSRGQIRLPPAYLTAAKGRVGLMGTLDLRSPEPVLRIPGKNQILDSVTLTPELTGELLSRINPIFNHVASAQGLVNLTVNNLVLPLGESGKDAAAGEGRLELVDSMVEAAGLLKELLALGGITADRGLISVRMKGLDFYVKDGRIHYQDFTLIFPEEFDMKFHGSVGLDGTLDLVVSIPVRPELMERLGVSGSATMRTREIVGERVDIPIVGTREQPILDLKRIDVNKLLQDALKRSAGETLEDALKDIFNKGKDDRKKGKKSNSHRN